MSLTNYGDAGFHPGIVQHPINIHYTSDGITHTDSIFGPAPDIPAAFAMTACFGLKDVDTQIYTFDAIGLEGKNTGRMSLAGIPAPDDCKKNEDLYMEYVQENMRCLGVTGPNIKPSAMGTDKSFPVLIKGATDVIVNADTKAGDTLVMCVPTIDRIKSKKNGTRLERLNPTAMDVVPLNRQYITDSVQTIAHRALNRLPVKSLFTRKKGGARRMHYTRAMSHYSFEDMITRKSGSGDNDAIVPLSSGGGIKPQGMIKQTRVMASILAGCLTIAEDMEKSANNVSKMTLGEQNDTKERLASHFAALVGNLDALRQCVSTALVGRALYDCKAGFATSVHVRNGGGT